MQSDRMSVASSGQIITLTHYVMGYWMYPSLLVSWGVINVLVVKLLSHSNSGWIQASAYLMCTYPKCSLIPRPGTNVRMNLNKLAIYQQFIVASCSEVPLGSSVASLVPRFPRSGTRTLNLCRCGDPGIFSHVRSSKKMDARQTPPQLCVGV